MPYYIGINELQELKGNLERDPVCNSSIIGFIENNLTVEILSEDRTYLVKGISDREWIYFASEDKEVFRNLLSKLYLTDKCFASLEDWMIPEVIKLGKVDWQLTTMRYFLPESAVLPDNKIAIRKLYTDEAAYIRENSNYKQFLPIEYIEQRIRKSFSAGITENNKLVAWAITHDDGAIGNAQRGTGMGNESRVSRRVYEI